MLANVSSDAIRDRRGGEMTIFSELWSTSLKSVIQSIVELRRPPFSRSEIKFALLTSMLNGWDLSSSFVGSS